MYTKTRKEHETLFEEIIKLVQKDKKSNLFKNVNSRIVKFGILGMCNWIIKWYDEGGRSTLEEIYEGFHAIITRKPAGHSKNETALTV